MTTQGIAGQFPKVVGNDPKPDIVVRVVGIVPVAIGDASVTLIIVPRAAPHVSYWSAPIQNYPPKFYYLQE